MWHACVKREIGTGFWWGYLKVRHPVEFLDVDGRLILKLILKGIEWEGEF
jgi:hypothetical protein